MTMSSRLPAVLTDGVALLERSMSFTLGGLLLVTPAALTNPTPCAEWDVHALVNHIVNEINIQCLASQLPEFITVDLGELTKGQSLHVSDIKLPPGTKVVTHGKPNPGIASANVQAAEVEEVAPAPVVAAAAPAPTKAKKTEKQNKK